MGFIMKKLKDKAKEAVDKRIFVAVVDKATKVYPESKLLEQKQNNASTLIIHQPSRWKKFYTINNANGEKKYKAEVGTFFRSTYINISGTIKTEHWIANKKRFTAKPTLVIKANKKEVGKLIKTKKSPNPQYKIDYLGWRGEGDYWESNLDFYDSHGLVVSISWSHNKSLVVSFPDLVPVGIEISAIILALILDTTGRLL